MRRELAIEFSRATEAAALAGYKWLGRGDKNAADGAAAVSYTHLYYKHKPLVFLKRLILLILWL